MDPDDNEYRWVLAGAAMLTQADVDVFVPLLVGDSKGSPRSDLEFHMVISWDLMLFHGELRVI